MSAVSLARSQRGKKKRTAAKKREEALHEIALRKLSADFAEPGFATAEAGTPLTFGPPALTPGISRSGQSWRT